MFKKQISNHMSVSVIACIYNYIIVDKKDMTACVGCVVKLGV